MKVVSRLGALVVAVALVVGAIALRGGDGDGSTAVLAGGAVTVDCPSDLGGVCDSLAGLDDVEVDRVATATQAAAAAGERLERPWLVPVAWADVVDDARSRGSLEPLARSEVVASSPLLLVGYEQRLGAIARQCGVAVEDVTMACLVGLAGQEWRALGEDPRWGRVALGHRSPESSTGLLATAAVAAAVAGPDFGMTDLRDDPAASTAFRQLEGAVDDFDPPAGGHVRLLRTVGPSTADLVVTVEADAIDLNDPALEFGRLLASPVETGWSVELVVVGDDAGAVADVSAALTDGATTALDERGWRTTGESPTGSPVDALPAPDPRPDGPSLTALRTVWAEQFR